ncbi:MAG: glycosyltransferase family 2 protein [Bacteroidales bacterium]|nr:glycosyltransferase family 2 protein [Bacteroidales bacterium]
MMDSPLISIIIPCWNEEKFIGKILDDLDMQDYPQDKMEIFVVDGNSTDGTIPIVNGFLKKNPHVRMLVNDKQYVPFALNLGITHAHGEWIIIMGSHARYPINYVSTLINASLQLNADNVGLRCRAVPPDATATSLAIATALSSPFGMGNSWFRIGSTQIKEVDTVTFGCYHRTVFEKIGLFDETLLRNQDDEFNARLIKAGGKIYLIPGLSIDYYPRNTLTGIFRMFYQYGLFKPLVSRKIGKPTTIRQLAPFFFVLFLLGALISPFLGGNIYIFFLFGLATYFLFSIFFSIQLIFSSHRLSLLFLLPITYFIIHFSYGIGYWQGAVKFIVLNKQKNQVQSSR